MIGVMFVCLGNICRSPMAEGAFRKHVEAAGLGAHFRILSSGTAGYHVGEAPDPRAQKTALGHGVDISMLRGRQLVKEDLASFDYVVAMDRSNWTNIQKLYKRGHTAKTSMLLEELPDAGTTEVPDPYYGGDAGFEHVWSLVDRAGARLLARLRRAHGL
ncbi:MAG: low molecular weight phosphotyrosine protein phosphatase [Myxococcales bacterium]|nr:low molecular weight phosphotyrosine protein phosphatase [Myxococcales bacterium]